MKIRFLGTSHGVPMPGRNYQSILLEIRDELYLIDAGAPVMEMLIDEGYDLRKLKAVFITHLHTDHMNGLMNLCNLSTWYYQQMRYTVYLPEQRGAEALSRFCAEIMQMPLSDRITFQIIHEGCFFENQNLKINAVKTDHMAVSYGFYIEAEKKNIYVTGDLHWTLNDFARDLPYQRTDVLITECAHFGVQELMEKMEHINLRKAMVIHVFPTANYELLKSFRETCAFELILPKDHEIYEI